MGGEPYRIMELTPYVGASKANIISYPLCDDAYFLAFFVFGFVLFFLYLALRPVDIAMGTMLAVVGVFLFWLFIFL